MERIKDHSLVNIMISNIRVQDKKLPYWINECVMLKRTGQRFYRAKKFSVKTQAREGIVDFCKQIDEEFSRTWLESSSAGTVSGTKFDLNSHAIENVGTTVENPDVFVSQQKKRKAGDINSSESFPFSGSPSSFTSVFEVVPACSVSNPPSEQEVDLSDTPCNSGASTEFSPEQAPFSAFPESKSMKLSPSMIMKVTYVEIMETLKKAITTGNFYELWDGPFLEMSDGSGKCSYVSDCTRFQHTQLIRNSTALYFYYE